MLSHLLFTAPVNSYLLDVHTSTLQRLFIEPLRLSALSFDPPIQAQTLVQGEFSK